ncbi:hypothetical protein V7793_28285, partial [Streptomyces sp. KLMMK]|uniref:hypothetical protein n=1 Tax=Streptomyces sp. KLMMK TaxID=3109353 RepID=UPI0030099A56
NRASWEGVSAAGEISITRTVTVVLVPLCQRVASAANQQITGVAGAARRGEHPHAVAQVTRARYGRVAMTTV